MTESFTLLRVRQTKVVAASTLLLTEQWARLRRWLGTRTDFSGQRERRLRMWSAGDLSTAWIGTLDLAEWVATGSTSRRVHHPAGGTLDKISPHRSSPVLDVAVVGSGLSEFEQQDFAQAATALNAYVVSVGQSMRGAHVTIGDPTGSDPLALPCADGALIHGRGSDSTFALRWHDAPQDSAIQFAGSSILVSPEHDAPAFAREAARLGRVLRPGHVVMDQLDQVHPWRRVVVLLGILAAGATVHSRDLPAQERGLLGENLSTLLLEEPGADPTAVERAGSRQWREVMRTHSSWARWDQLRLSCGIRQRPPPSVSIVTATRRPRNLEHLANQLRKLEYPSLEVVIVLHGDGFEPDLAPLDDVPHRVEVLRAPEEWVLGDLLNAACDVAGGEIISKIDDDDWYGPRHIHDVVGCLRATGATLVGKAAEFVYLQTADLTIRRDHVPAFRYGAHPAGPTLTIPRSDLRELGGWRRAPRAVDKHLVNSTLQAGAQVYATAGFGFTLNRTPSDHTWNVDEAQLRRLAAQEWAGCRLDVSDSE